MSADNLPTNTRSRQEWAAVICADWRKSIDSIIQTGRDLAAAKAELPHGEFSQMVREDLPFVERTAESLMRVAVHPVIANPQSTSGLPVSWAVLSELSRLKEADFRDALGDGLVKPQTSLRAARAISESFNKPGGTIGEGRKPSTLPTPNEAREIAAATGRLVAASDGNTYSGATAEQGADYANRRTAAFRTFEAVALLAEAGDAEAFVASLEPHWLHDFRFSAIDEAIAFLPRLKAAMGVVDA
jgi:hypothetical protein